MNGTATRRDFNAIVGTVQALESEITRTVGHGHDLSVQAGAALRNLLEARQQRSYGVVARATFVLGRLAGTATALSLSKGRAVDAETKALAREWSAVAQEVTAEIVAAM